MVMMLYMIPYSNVVFSSFFFYLFRRREFVPLRVELSNRVSPGRGEKGWRSRDRDIMRRCKMRVTPPLANPGRGVVNIYIYIFNYVCSCCPHFLVCVFILNRIYSGRDRTAALKKKWKS